MSNWTHVSGKFILKVNCKKGILPIYKIIANAPIIDGGEFPAVYSIHPMGQYPKREGTSEQYYYTAKIAIIGDLSDCDLDETCSDVEAFINYLAGIEGTSAYGKIEVKEDHHTKIEKHFSISTHKTFNINF